MAGVTAGSGSQVSKSQARNASSQFMDAINTLAGGINEIEGTRQQFLNSQRWSGPKKDDFDGRFVVFVNNMVTLNTQSNQALGSYGQAMNTRFAAEGEGFSTDTAQVSNVNATVQKSDSDTYIADFPSIQAAIDAYHRVSKTLATVLGGIKKVLSLLKVVWISAAAQVFIRKLEALIKVVEAAKNMLDRAANALDERLAELKQAVEDAKNIVEAIADFGALDFSGTF